MTGRNKGRHANLDSNAEMEACHPAGRNDLVVKMDGQMIDFVE